MYIITDVKHLISDKSLLLVFQIVRIIIIRTHLLIMFKFIGQ